MSAPPSTAAAAVVDVILRDGSTLRLRAPAHNDAGALVTFFERLSNDSRYLRFHGVRRVDVTLVEHVLDPNWTDRGALIGTLTDAQGDERVVALAEYARLRDPASAEVAFTVADDLQGRGAATRLLEQLAARAAEVGIEGFVAEVLPENSAMLAVFRDAGFEESRKLSGGEVEVHFPIASTERFLARVEERDHIAVAASLRPFFAPASVAVIGASKRRGSIGGELFRNILEADFTGATYPVNREGEPVAGVRAYRTIEEIPDPVDLAVISVPGKGVLESAEEALRKGVRALCVISAGFAEVGSEGVERQEKLLALVRAHGARLVGPNCLGIAVPPIGLNATFAPRALPSGRIAFSSQSGALGLALLEKASERGLGFSAFVSIGNKADVSSNDLLEWWEEDDGTDVVLLYLESFGNPQKFARVAGRLARRKPILALKAGTSRAGARAASSHTAALAGSDAAVEALFRSSGVLRARNLEELVDVATLLSSQPLPAGRRVAVLTNAGGLGILCADACEAAHLELPELTEETRQALSKILPSEASVVNPIDLLGSATGEVYTKVLPHILRDPGIDAVIALFVPPVVAGADEVAAAMRVALEREPSDKPVLAVVVSADGTPETLRDPASPLATFAYPESAAHALGVAAGRAEWLRRPAGTVPEIDKIDVAAARRLVDSALADSGDVWLDAADIRTLLTAYGVPLVPEQVAADADEAVAAADALGRPVVLKTAVAGVHKTESGGVALNLETDEEIRAAAERIGGPLLVQPMIGGGTELLAGVVQDPLFGGLVAVGPGGVFAELIGGAEFRIAPLTDRDADELVNGGKAGQLVRGFRGAAAADDNALTSLVHRLSRLAVDFPEVAELDLNPIIALPTGCVAVDARIRLRSRSEDRSLKSW
ncbi:MAG TPA: GNAT family N-acetyltransferase [Gaiellaceae bacterium]|nr:GNAT family N-acetyltransferase [Gaiellaceae bacterium]